MFTRTQESIQRFLPTFQRYINENLEGRRDLKYLAYFDDILVYGKTFDEQLENLEAVLMK